VPPAAPVDAKPAPVLPQQPVRLAELAQAAQTAIRVTANGGGASATIVLHPEELGKVEIKLSYGADGITATVRADNPQAAQTLLQAGGDLRRALEQQGMPLLDLDIRERNARDEVPQDAQRSKRGFGGGSDLDDEDDLSISVDPVRLPAAGSTVDVLA
jgi:flagellar hook-length control protein FliK